LSNDDIKQFIADNAQVFKTYTQMVEAFMKENPEHQLALVTPTAFLVITLHPRLKD
jgi:hypothetical protein